MVLTIGHYADLFQVKLGIVPPSMLSSRCFGTDDQLSIGYLFIWYFQNLLEVLDEWISFMKAILNPLKKLLKDSPILDTCFRWEDHVVEPCSSFHLSIQDIELCEYWIVTRGMLKRSNQGLNAALEYDAWLPGTLRWLPMVHQTCQADCIIEGPSILAEEYSVFRLTFEEVQ